MYDLSLLRGHGVDVYISENVEIKRPHFVSVGSHVAIDSYFYCTTQAKIGSYVHIAPMVSVIGGAGTILEVDDFSTIAAGCRLICASDEYLGAGLVSPLIPREFRDRVINSPIILERLSALASNVVVAPGVTLGEGSVVGANSYVNRDIPAWEIWAGSPVRFIRKRESLKMLRYAEELLG